MKDSFLWFFIILLLLGSCKSMRKGIDVSVLNSTDTTLYNVSVTAASKEILFDSIPPKSHITKYLDMEDLYKISGGYKLKFRFPDGLEMSGEYGSFLNGFPNNYQMCIQINSGTAIVLFDSYCDLIGD